jgi:hypothetical protein
MSYPVTFEMDYLERRSRLTTFFRYLLAIPQFIFACVYMFAFCVAEIIAWFALMFTARWPVGLYEFSCGFLRYQARLTAYLALGVDQYPPFSGAEHAGYPVRVQIARPLEHYSRVKVFFRPLYAIVAIAIRYVLGLLMAAVSLLSWFAIVFTGRQPASLQSALNFALSYTIQADALLFLITETYPPFPEGRSPTPQPTF